MGDVLRNFRAKCAILDKWRTQMLSPIFTVVRPDAPHCFRIVGTCFWSGGAKINVDTGPQSDEHEATRVFLVMIASMSEMQSTGFINALTAHSRANL